MRFQMLSPDEIDQYTKDDASLIIDLREPADYAKDHIWNAVNNPYRSWKRYANSQTFQNMKEKKKVILYCERGPTSFAVAKELAENGIPVSVLVGGMKAYRGKIKERY